MKQRVSQYIKENSMICPGDTVVAGVSGGADSLCLFLLLHELQEDLRFCLHVVHVHHGLRDSAQEDLAFVEKLCREMQVPASIIKVDAAAHAKEWGTGVEEAGRRLRYEAFRQVCDDLARSSGRQKDTFRIAVAHHREDQAETVLFHLCRGTDLRGARGMLPVNGPVIRPLLRESRASIEAYLSQRGFSWQEDETNTDTAYTRNFLRREILPRLESGVHAAAAEQISRFAGVCAEAEEYLTVVTDRALEKCRYTCVPEEGIYIPDNCRCLYALRLACLLQEEPYLQGRILYRCLADSIGSAKDLGTVHIEALRSLCAKETDGQLSMPSGILVFKSAGRLFFCREGGPSHAETEGSSADRQVCSYPLSEAEYECRELVFDGSMSAIPRNEYTKWFDYDKIGTFPVFRTRQPGDCMFLFADGKMPQGTNDPESGRAGDGTETAQRMMIAKKLARIMLDGKIPAGVRDRIVLPFCEKEALWIPGLRMGDSCKVTPATKRVLEIRWRSGGTISS